MAIEYTWSITRLECAPAVGDLTNVVKTAFWRCEGVDGETKRRREGMEEITLAEGGDFTAYDKLTQDQVLAWVWAGRTNKDRVEASVASAIDFAKNPPPPSTVTLDLPF